MDTVSLSHLAEQHLTQARAASSGRSAQTIHGGHERPLRQTVIALAAGHRLGDHDRPDDATLQVLRGRVRLTAGAETWEGATGDYLAIPDQRHDLEAIEDSAILLTTLVPTAP